MTKWAVAAAKAQFSELIHKAISEGPQEVTKSGKSAVIVVSREDWEKRGAKPPKESLVDFFRNSPAYGLDIDFKRVDLKPRKLKL